MLNPPPFFFSKSLNAFPQQMNMNATGNPYQQQQVPWQVTGATNLSFSHPVGGNQMFSQFTGMPNNPYQQQTIANPYQQQQQPQFTGMMQQPMVTGMQFQTPQMTGMQYQQAQPTGMQFPTSSISSMQTGQNNPFGANAGNTSQSNFMSSPSLQSASTFGQSLQPQQTGFQASSYGSHSPQPSHFSIENQSVRC
jgi:hypothetical protein